MNTHNSLYCSAPKNKSILRFMKAEVGTFSSKNICMERCGKKIVTNMSFFEYEEEVILS